LAKPGSSTALAVWQIAKLAYDANDNLLSITWPQNANGVASSDYNFVWDSRITYTYS
jgi:YD repeat-containing protein